jgi:hypothetical protein
MTEALSGMSSLPTQGVPVGSSPVEAREATRPSPVGGAIVDDISDVKATRVETPV